MWGFAPHLKSFIALYLSRSWIEGSFLRNVALCRISFQAANFILSFVVFDRINLSRICLVNCLENS